MARSTRAALLETRTARLKLPVRKKPYSVRVSPSLRLGYRRNQTAGVWSVIVADGKGGSWMKKFALADDFEDSEGRHVLDFWQADASGAYDNSGYRLRGHQSAGSDGVYHLDTIIPGLYPGRTEHIHVKVARPGASPLTTQLYFPGVARNQQDGIFDPSLLVNLSDSGGGKLATFDFVLG